MTNATNPTTPTPVRFAVVGLGHFAQVAVLPGIQRLEEARVVALVSGDAEKLAVLGTRYDVPLRSSYDDYDGLLQSGAIDAVYIATPNDTHATYAIRAAEHGIHVLCEKPMAPTSGECEAMVDAAEANDVRLMIAYRLHFEPANLTAVEALQKKQIGEPRLFNSVFTLQVRPENTRVQNRAGAGPLYDIGTYCINAARYLFRAEPTSLIALSGSNPSDERFRFSEEAIAATMLFPGERLANFAVSFGTASTARYEVLGTDGVLRADSAYEYVEDIELVIETSGQTTRQTFHKRDQIAAEIRYFARCVRDGVDPEPSGYEGLADVRIIEAIQRSAATGRRVEPVPTRRDVRPSIDQAATVPPHPKPRTVGVRSGSLPG